MADDPDIVPTGPCSARPGASGCGWSGRPTSPSGPARRWRTCSGPGTRARHPGSGSGGGLVTIEYGPRLRPGDWRRQAADIRLNPSVGWRIEAPRGVAGLQADLSAARLLGMEVDHAAASSELTLARPSNPVLLQFGGGTGKVTIHRPIGTAARVKVTQGGASGISFDDQSYKAVGGEATWKTSDFEQATDRYDIAFAKGVRDLMVNTLDSPPTQAPPAAGHGPVHRHRRLDPAGPGGRRPALAGAAGRPRRGGPAADRPRRRPVGQEHRRRRRRSSTGRPGDPLRPGPPDRAARHRHRDPGRPPHRGAPDLLDDDVGGIAVHIAARIMAAAGPGQVLVSRTVRDLVVGSGIALEDRGTMPSRALTNRGTCSRRT